MSKRVAERQLTADNWDKEDDEDEEIQGSIVASEEILKNRVIKTAKRRIQGGSNVDEERKSIFGSFSGFQKTPSSTSAASPFGFLSKLTNGGNDKPQSSSTSPIDKITDTKPAAAFKIPQAQVPASSEKDSAKEEADDEYCSNLKSLNQGVCEWIKSHIDKNPYCILTPIFDDYKKYLSELDKKKTEKNNNKKTAIESVKPAEEGKKLFTNLSTVPLTTTSATLASPIASEPPKFSFLSSASPTNTFKNDSKFSTPVPNISQGFTSTPMFNFGTKLSESTSNNFTLGGAPQFNSGQEEEKTEQEDDEPPKTTFKPVVEEDSVFSKRCKVFVKKEDGYADRGVGTLFVKPIADSEKHQLIVRADTSLGNLLLNIVLSSSIPLQRLGKNNVMMMCIPTPDSKPPPVSTLLRVKTGDEADELLKTLQKFQK